MQPSRFHQQKQGLKQQRKCQLTSWDLNATIDNHKTSKNKGIQSSHMRIFATVWKSLVWSRLVIFCMHVWLNLHFSLAEWPHLPPENLCFVVQVLWVADAFRASIFGHILLTASPSAAPKYHMAWQGLRVSTTSRGSVWVRWEQNIEGCPNLPRTLNWIVLANSWVPCLFGRTSFGGSLLDQESTFWSPHPFVSCNPLVLQTSSNWGWYK